MSSLARYRLTIEPWVAALRYRTDRRIVRDKNVVEIAQTVLDRYPRPLKPVIGNHKGTWACFNDGPDGEAPGIIPDIKAWATKHNWAVPKRPKNVREFMDKKPDATDLME